MTMGCGLVNARCVLVHEALNKAVRPEVVDEAADDEVLAGACSRDAFSVYVDVPHPIGAGHVGAEDECVCEL